MRRAVDKMREYMTEYLMLGDNNINKDDKLSAGLVSSTCQFCGESFSRANDLSLHYEEQHSEEIGKET